MAGVYRPRHPERTVLYRVLFHHFERFLAEYETHFEGEYGFLRPVVKEVVERYLDCGNPRCGFARIRCPDCKAGLTAFPLRIVEKESRCIPSQGWAEMIRKVYEVDPMVCPKCGGTMKVVAFLTEHAVVDRIIDHLKLTFVANRPPPPQVAFQEFLMAVDRPAEYLP